MRKERSRGEGRDAAAWDRDRNEQKFLTDINQACQSPAWLSSLQGTDPDGPTGHSAPARGDHGPVPTYIDVVGVDVIRVGIAQQRMELHTVPVIWEVRGEGGIRRWQGQRVTCPPSVSNRALGSASSRTKLQRAARHRGKQQQGSWRTWWVPIPAATRREHRTAPVSPPTTCTPIPGAPRGAPEPYCGCYRCLSTPKRPIFNCSQLQPSCLHWC